MSYIYTNSEICLYCRVGLRKIEKAGCCGRKVKRDDLYVCKRCGRKYVKREK